LNPSSIKVCRNARRAFQEPIGRDELPALIDNRASSSSPQDRNDYDNENNKTERAAADPNKIGENGGVGASYR
jgi:hypothetical protein